MDTTAAAATPNASLSTVVLNNETPRDFTLATVEVATLAAMFVTAVTGNAVTLVAILLRRGPRRKLSRMRYLIGHLCVADLLVAFFHILAQLVWDITGNFIGGYTGDDALCRAVKFLQLLGPYLSAYVLVAAAVDRYMAICYPLKEGCCKRLVGTAWGLAMVCSVPQTLVFSYTSIPSVPLTVVVYECWATFAKGWGEKAYITFYACAVFVVPFWVLVFTYVGICRAIWTNIRRKRANRTDGPTTANVDDKVCSGGPSNDSNPRTHSLRGISRAKMKTVKLTVVVIVCYVFCSMPYISAMLWLVWYPEARQTAFAQSAAFTILALLASLNSCANPWIYLAFNENVAQTLSDVITCRKCRSAPNGHVGNTVLSRSSLSETGQQRCATHSQVHTLAQGPMTSTAVI